MKTSCQLNLSPQTISNFKHPPHYSNHVTASYLHGHRNTKSSSPDVWWSQASLRREDSPNRLDTQLLLLLLLVNSFYPPLHHQQLSTRFLNHSGSTSILFHLQRPVALPSALYSTSEASGTSCLPGLNRCVTGSSAASDLSVSSNKKLCV